MTTYDPAGSEQEAARAAVESQAAARQARASRQGQESRKFVETTPAQSEPESTIQTAGSWSDTEQQPQSQYVAYEQETRDARPESERARNVVTNAMSATEQVGSGFVGGIAHMATDLVHGVGDVGNEVVSVVRDTASTAISGVGTVGEAAVNTLTGLLVGLVSGVRQVGAAAAGRTSITVERPIARQSQSELRQAENRQRENVAEEMYH